MTKIINWVKNNFKQELLTMIKYGTIGVLNTAVFSIVTYLVSLTGVHYAVYTAIGYIVAIFFSFYMNNRYTFNKKENDIKPVLMKFLGVTISLMLLVQVIQYVFIDLFKTREIIGIIAGMIFYTGTGYLFNRNFVFKHTNKIEEE